MPQKITTTVVTTTTTTTEEIVDKKLVETHYLLILDKSGSMDNVRQTTINGFNEQIQTIKQLEKDFPDQKYFISLVSFNHSVDTIYSNVPASEVKELTLEDYVPGGTTALVDAMGEGISKLDDFIRPEMNNKEKIVTAVVVIMTDGEENASRNWNQGEKIKTLIERLNKDDKWTISYVGANQDAILNSASYGIAAGNTVNYTASVGGTASVGRAMSHTMHTRAKNINTNAYSFAGGTLDSVSLFAGYAGNIDENLAAEPSKDLLQPSLVNPLVNSTTSTANLSSTPAVDPNHDKDSDQQSN